jgi:thiamine biosynthesis protein ThiS
MNRIQSALGLALGLMELTLNGERIMVEPDITVASLIRRHQLGGSACAVEVNRRIIPRRDHDSHQLHPGDTVEVVTLVGGG